MFAHGELGPNKGVPITVAPGEVGRVEMGTEGRVGGDLAPPKFFFLKGINIAMYH